MMHNDLTRRNILSTIGLGIATGLTGCSNESNRENENKSEDDTASNDKSNPVSQNASGDSSAQNLDAAIEYVTHIESYDSNRYDLPTPEYTELGWEWRVLDFEVTKGEIEMKDIAFNCMFETDERYYRFSPISKRVNNGLELESPDTIQEGERGIALFDHPASVSDPVGLNLSMTEARIGGDGVRTEGLDSFNPSVSMEVSFERDREPAILDELAASEGRSSSQDWVITTIQVTDGVLNAGDVIENSQLQTDQGSPYSLNPATGRAKKGTHGGTFVKSGNIAHALYSVQEFETIEDWGYTNPRQDVDVQVNI